MNLGGRGCSELRSHHCTPAWGTVQVDHREDVLHHQVIHPEENEQLDNHTDAREEGKNKYKKQGSVRKKTNKETKRTGGNPVGGSFDMKI